MMRVNVTAIQRAAENMRVGAGDALGDFAIEVAEQMKEKAVERTPVDTGYMQKNWQVSSSGEHSALLENTTRYASFVEYGRRNRFGGRFVPGQKFMTTAMIETEEQLPKMVEQRMKAFFGGVFG